jgi:hypothetical protein
MATFSSGFTVMLPSNSNMAAYPHNVGSDFTVKLPTPLNLSRHTLNEDVRWQVAMTSVHYTHNFYNFLEPCTLRFVVEMPLPAHTDLNEAPSSMCIPIDRRMKMRGIDETDRAILLQYMAYDTKDTLSIERELLFGKVRIPAGYYASTRALCDVIMSEFDKVFSPRYKVQLQISASSNGTLTFQVRNSTAMVMYSNKPYVGHVLGLNTTEASLHVFEYNPVRMPHLLPRLERMNSAEERRWDHGNTTLLKVRVFKLDMEGTRTPKLDCIQAMYVYADIVEQQFVGDVMAPLLGYVDVTSSPGDRITHTCDPPVYLCVDKSTIDRIRIRISDQHGNDVMFPDDSSNVVVRLHFRRT